MLLSHSATVQRTCVKFSQVFVRLLRDYYASLVADCVNMWHRKSDPKKPNTRKSEKLQTQPNITHGLTKPASISGVHILIFCCSNKPAIDFRDVVILAKIMCVVN